MIESSGISPTFFLFGILQGSLILAAGFFMRSPASGEVRYS